MAIKLKSFTVYFKSMQKTIQLQIKRRDFVPIGIGNKCILPYAVRTANDTYYDQYFPGIGQIEQTQKLYPELKLFVPSSVDIGYLFEKVEPFLVGTGTVLLRPNKDGYADERVRYKDGAKVELRTPVVGHHGESWVTAENGKAMVITDYQKLREYSEIKVFNTPIWKYIKGFDEKERGVPTEFDDKPNKKYKNARVWVNPNLLIAPLDRGPWHVDSREWLYGSTLVWDSGNSGWRFPLGSEAPVDRKQLLNEQLSILRRKVGEIPNLSLKEIPTYVRNLDPKFEELSKDLLSE